tara:strand:+ start:2924 stop:3895 length:972 start_codon:yes stop_codon:yes gene_type:complete
MKEKEIKEQLADISELMLYVDKPYRIEALHALHYEVEPVNFWTMFHQHWNSVENPSDFTDMLHSMFEYDDYGFNYDMLQDESRLNTLEPEDKAFYLSLPDEFAVFRGCHSFNEQGFSWTTDREVAERFALRMAIDKEYILLQGMVRKTDVICAYDNREEKEILVLPKKVIIVGRERANDPVLRSDDFKEYNDTSNIYHMVQTGRYRQLQSEEELKKMADGGWVFTIADKGFDSVKKYVNWFDELLSLIEKHKLESFSPTWYASAYDRYVTGKDILEGDPRGVVKQAQQIIRLRESEKVSTNEELDDIIDNAMQQAQMNDAKTK